jgi:hypothetical protein
MYKCYNGFKDDWIFPAQSLTRVSNSVSDTNPDLGWELFVG